jgi:hypothetical protein
VAATDHGGPLTGGRTVPLEPEPGTARVQAADRDGAPDGTPDDDRDDDRDEPVPPAAGPAGAGPDTPAPDADESTEPAELTPGAVPPVPVASLWEGDSAQELRTRWREVQLRFVDDPRGAADEAQALVGEAVDALTSALAQQRTALDGWRSGGSGSGGDSGESTDTERLRVAVRGYREFLDRLLGL